MIYIRWRAGEPRRGRVFDPLAADHPATMLPCHGCDQPIGTTVPTQLIAAGPDSEDNQAKHDAGSWYSAAAILLHKGCADALTDEGLDLLISELVADKPAAPEPAPQSDTTFCPKGCVDGDDCKGSLAIPCARGQHPYDLGESGRFQPCGCLERSRCPSCGNCTNCDGCYCGED